MSDKTYHFVLWLSGFVEAIEIPDKKQWAMLKSRLADLDSSPAIAMPSPPISPPEQFPAAPVMSVSYVDEQSRIDLVDVPLPPEMPELAS